MTYYRSTITKKWMSHNFIKGINYIFGKGYLEKLVNEGILEEVKEPSIEDCIRYGAGASLPVVRYRELYPDVSWAKAQEEVAKIREKIERKPKRK